MPAPYRTSFNGRLDRLSALIERLRVHVDTLPDGEAQSDGANLCIYQSAGGRRRLVFCPPRTDGGPEGDMLEGAGPTEAAFAGGSGQRRKDMPRPEEDETVVVAARIAISGIGRQLISALPASLSLSLEEEPYLDVVATPLIEEVATPRCGGQAAFQRLCEVLVIRLLRHAMEAGKADTGLLGGLAHPRVAAALVAIHETPGEAWTLERLAQTAGMSRTQFAVTFRDLVGATPMGYLSAWRLDIGRAELDAGRQVKAVASLCGFASPAAFSRAYARRFGHPPKKRRA